MYKMWSDVFVYLFFQVNSSEYRAIAGNIRGQVQSVSYHGTVSTIIIIHLGVHSILYWLYLVLWNHALQTYNALIVCYVTIHGNHN